MVSCVVELRASIAHWVAAVVLLTSRVCPSVWKRSEAFGGGVSGGVGKGCGSGVRLCSMVSSVVAICHCRFSSFS